MEAPSSACIDAGRGSSPYYILLIFAGCSLIGLSGWMIEILKNLSKKVFRVSASSFVLHAFICTIALICFLKIFAGNADTKTGIILCIVIFLFAFAFTGPKDNPFAAKSGLMFPIILGIMSILWSANIAEDEVLVNFFHVLGADWITDIISAFSFIFGIIADIIATPVCALIAKFFPSLTLFTDPPLIILMVYTYVLSNFIIMLGIDLRFSIEYKLRGIETVKDKNRNTFAAVGMILSLIAIVIMCLMFMNNFAHVWNPAFSGIGASYGEDVSRTMLIGWFVAIFCFNMFSRIGDPFSNKSIIISCLGTIIVGFCAGTITYEAHGYSPVSASGAWKMLGIVLLGSIIAMIIGRGIGSILKK